MKMQLYIKSRNENGLLNVDWHTPHGRKGTLEVNFNDSKLTDKELLVAAELVAIRHLIIQHQVFGDGVAGGIGKGVTITSTRGAVRKALRKQGKTENLHGFTFFIQRLAHLEIEVIKKWQEPHESESEAEFQSIEAISRRYETFDIPKGKLEVTDHALEKFVERLMKTNPGSKDPLSVMLKHLRHEKLRTVDLEENVKKHKSLKYGENDDSEHWNVPGSRWHYVMAPVGDNTYRMITSYILDKNRH